MAFCGIPQEGPQKRLGSPNHIFCFLGDSLPSEEIVSFPLSGNGIVGPSWSSVAVLQVKVGRTQLATLASQEWGEGWEVEGQGTLRSVQHQPTNH